MERRLESVLLSTIGLWEWGFLIEQFPLIPLPCYLFHKVTPQTYHFPKICIKSLHQILKQFKDSQLILQDQNFIIIICLQYEM